ncbi:major facilitator superfamily MFS_1 [Paenibacillus curdlanolyticus YK9]|uniref:Major facilitator superfamily MFS_1 n=1 Tax=Paenibacillus curdlanolyticus YK9 TaxID=717606 RepID=E0IE67_9BACL|nr:MFS transporter [Paenibacillus curdlanolyticus]EFM09421.1 major facilitator superfamily MFS_1 [Paenibacillus curdlanolyticus YK9]
MIFSVLRASRFRNYFIADIVSGFGVGMSTIGANWYLMDQTGSITSVGLMLSLNVIAGFLVSAFAGTFVDKWNRKSILLWANVVRAAALLLITGAFFGTGFHVEYLYAFAAVNGMGWALYMSASRSLVQELLTEKELIHGNSLIEISLQVGMFMAGGLSGVLYKYIGFEAILLLNAAAFLISSLFLSRISYSALPVEHDETSFFDSFKAGIHYLAERPSLFILGVVSIIPLVTTMVFNVVLPGYVSTSVGGDSIVFGLSDMSYGIGGLLSGFLAAPLARKLSQHGTILLIFLVSVVNLVAIAFNSTVLLLYIGCVIIGLTNSSLRILITTSLMASVSKSYMGRATSVWMGISLLLQTVSATGLGVVIDRFSPGLGFIVMGGLMLVGLIAYYVLNSKSKLPQKQTVEVEA